MTKKRVTVTGGSGRLRRMVPTNPKAKKPRRRFLADTPLVKTIESLKKRITKAAEGGVKFRRFVAMFLSLAHTGAKFTVRAIDARSYKDALGEAINHKPISDCKVFVLTAEQAEFLKNRLEQAESRRAPDVVVGLAKARAKATDLGG